MYTAEQIRELFDEREIRSLIYRYCRAIDRRRRILRRVCAYEWTRTDPLPPGWRLPESFVRGRRDASDIVYLPELPAPLHATTPVPRSI